MAKVIRVLTLTALAMNLLLSACRVQATTTPSPAPAPSETATRSPTPASSPEPSLSPTPESSPTATATPIPTPPFPASQVAHGLILSTGTSATCELPCWHGLRIGESARDDVEHVFMRLLGVEDGLDLFSPPIEEDLVLANILDVEGVCGGGHNWHFEDPETGVAAGYYLYAVVDEDTGLLVGIIEFMDSFWVYDVPSLPEIMARLGRPSWLYAGAGAVTFQVVLYYEQGIGVELIIDEDRVNTSTVSVCFDEDPVISTYHLVDPYTSLNEEDLSPVQRAWGAPHDPAPYIDEELGMSMDEFIEFINSDDPCIQVPR
jgi:hypothetical protein